MQGLVLLDSALLIERSVAVVLLLALKDLESFLDDVQLGLFLFQFGCGFTDADGMLRVAALSAFGLLVSSLRLFLGLHRFNFITFLFESTYTAIDINQYRSIKKLSLILY